MTLHAIILAAGEAVRFHGIRKQLLTLPNGDTLLERQIRQVRERGGLPFVVTLDESLAQYARFSGASVIEPYDQRFIVSSLLSTRDYWHKDRTLVLLGDVLYSKEVMDDLFMRTMHLGIWLNGRDVYALSFTPKHWVGIELGLRAEIISAEEWRRTGKLRSWFETVFPRPFAVAVDDYTRDFDSPDDVKHLKKLALDDRRTDEQR